MRALPVLPALLLLASVAAGPARADDLAPALRAALVRLYVTSQSYDATSPWQKDRPRNLVGRGVVVEPGVVLTPAGNVRDQLMIEVSVANSARKYPARLKHVDTRLGLALVEVTDEELRGVLRPLPLGTPIKLDDEVDLYQLGNDDLVERYTARVVRAEAAATRLSLRVKTTCSDAGNGQIAVRDGAVVGMLTSTMRSRQEGMLLSLESIRHYLDDFKDGTYHGCPGPGIWYHELLRDDLRAYYGLGKDQHGIAIRRVMPGRTGDGVLQEGDVLLEVDGHALDDEGKFEDDTHGRLDAGYLFRGLRYVGDTMKVKVLRKGEVKELELELKGQPASEMTVPEDGDERPEYLVVGGLVILELDQRNVNRISRSPGGVILRRYNERAGWDPPEGRDRIVYVDRVLADPANKGLDELRQTPILSVNGKPIRRIADVAAALETPEGAYHVFRLEGLESDFVVPAKDLATIDERVAKTYKVTRLRYLSAP